MTATINASTSSGVIVTSDTSGSLALQTANTTAMTIDTSQNVGIGVTPSAQYTGIKSFQVCSTNNLFDNGASTKFYHNAYTATSGNETYLTTGYAQAYLMVNNGQHIWYNAASGTAGTTFSFTQAMTLNANGALVLQGGSTSATGVGVAFPATQSASTDANTLDDYEEGTWTPSVIGNSMTGTSSASGKYTKTGRTVYCTGNITYTGLTGDDITMGGLPFENGSAIQATVNVYPGTTFVPAYVQTGNTYFYLTPNASYSGSNKTAYFSCWYQVN